MGGRMDAAYHRHWRAKNPGKQIEYSRRYRERHPERIKEIRKQSKAKNKGYWSRHWQEIKERVFNLYGDSCKRCGFADKRALQLDHVQDDGFKRRVRRKSGRRCVDTQHSWLDASREFQPDVYQILCANCNWIKRYEVNAKRLSDTGSTRLQ